jgi:hypothetical protein
LVDGVGALAEAEEALVRLGGERCLGLGRGAVGGAHGDGAASVGADTNGDRAAGGVVCLQGGGEGVALFRRGGCSRCAVADAGGVRERQAAGGVVAEHGFAAGVLERQSPGTRLDIDGERAGADAVVRGGGRGRHRDQRYEGECE